MAESSPTAAVQPKPRSTDREILTFAGVVAAAMVIFEVVSTVNGGGVLSFALGLSAAFSHARSIDIGSGAVLFPSLIAADAAVFGVCRLFRPNLAGRVVKAIVVIAVLACGIGLDLVCGEGLVTGIMTARGYSRCVARDHDVGSGKSHMSFDNYVPTGSWSRSICH